MMDKTKRVSNWYSFCVCKSCEKRLSEHVQMYNGGICPHCGHDDKSTICGTKNVILRKITFDPWWKFWNRTPAQYEGKNDFSKKWLLS